MKTVLKFVSLFVTVAMICGCAEEPPVNSSTLGFKWKTLVVNSNKQPIIEVDITRISKEDNIPIVYWRTLLGDTGSVDGKVQADGGYFLLLSKIDCGKRMIQHVKISAYIAEESDFLFLESRTEFERVSPVSSSEVVLNYICKLQTSSR
jgi:hypothetical protein